MTYNEHKIRRELRGLLCLDCKILFDFPRPLVFPDDKPDCPNNEKHRVVEARFYRKLMKEAVEDRRRRC